MIETKNLSTGYIIHSPQGRKTKVVHKDINVSLRAGELVSLVGTNGSGKSTLIKTLCGFQKPVAGTVSVDGDDLTRLSSKAVSRKVGVVLSQPPFIENTTAREVIEMGRYPYTGMLGTLSAADFQVVSSAVSSVGVDNLTNLFFNMMSDGEKQKVMIAKVLAQETPYIIMDEPMAFLDFPSRLEMMKLLSSLAKEYDKSVLFSSHNLEMARKSSDKVWLMDCTGAFLEVMPGDLADGEILCRFFNEDTARWLCGDLL